MLLPVLLATAATGARPLTNLVTAKVPAVSLRASWDTTLVVFAIPSAALRTLMSLSLWQANAAEPEARGEQVEITGLVQGPAIARARRPGT